jgi:hypothetical protein
MNKTKTSPPIQIIEDTYDKYLTKRNFKLVNNTSTTIEFQRGDDDHYELTENDIIYIGINAELNELTIELIGDFNLQDFGMIMSYLNKVIPSDITTRIIYGNANSVDIDEMIEDYFLETGKFFFFTYKFYPQGLFPISEYKKDIIKNFNYEDIDDIYYWYDENKDIANEFLYPYFPKAVLNKGANKLFTSLEINPNNLKTKLSIPSLKYERSGRLYSRMSGLRTKNQNVINLSKYNVPKSGTPFPVKIGDKVNYLIPVVRYSKSIEGGIYYNEDKESNFCGTFYYWEPDSKIYLNMGEKKNFNYFETKVECASKILNYYSTSKLKNKLKPELQELESDLNIVLNTIARQFYKYEELYITDEQVDNGLNIKDITNDILDFMSGDTPKYLTVDSIENYKSTKTGQILSDIFYAAEDQLDQSICNIAKKIELDVIILAKMMGTNRVVTEILDTRSRMTSIKNLVYGIN